jgi:hypothetical protein
VAEACYNQAMRFWLGLLVGALIGAGATWAGMARPWKGKGGEAAVAEADAGPSAGKVAKKKKKRGRRGRRGSSSGGETTFDDEPDEPAAPVLSAADKAMVWRGPKITLPRRTIDMAGGDDGRPLDAGEINDVMRSSSQGILDCIESSRAGAVLSATIKLEMLVGGDGGVDKVRFGAPAWFIDHGFGDCASRAARRIRFPATGAATFVSLPFNIH